MENVQLHTPAPSAMRQPARTAAQAMRRTRPIDDNFAGGQDLLGAGDAQGHKARLYAGNRLAAGQRVGRRRRGNFGAAERAPALQGKNGSLLSTGQD